jgi:AcrR family transcriptional regulator
MEREQERREQILNAAEVVFSERGFDKARMDDIVREAGISKGALYWYYKSKDALIRALLDRVFFSELREVEALLQDPGPASERMYIFIERAVREYRRFERLLPLAYEFIALAARNTTVRETIIGYFEHYLELLSTMIDQGIEEGEFAPCDSQQAAMALISMYEGLALLWFIKPQLVEWEKMGRAPLDIFLRGLEAGGS